MVALWAPLRLPIILSATSLDCKKTFQADYSRRGYRPQTRSDIYFLTVNGNGIRAISRIPGISRGKVSSTLRGFEPELWRVNHACLESLAGKPLEIETASGTEAEMDEMRGFVRDKSQQRWLWQAIDHKTGAPLAFCFGSRKSDNLDRLLELLKPFSVTKAHADRNPAYASRIPAEGLEAGKLGTRRIERLHLCRCAPGAQGSCARG